MSLPARRVVHAGDALARERLAAYTRYADLLADQERALERGDVELFKTLAQDAERMQAALHGVVDDVANAPHSIAERVTDVLMGAVARSERIQERLRGLRGEMGAELRGVSGQRSRARRYLSGTALERIPSFDTRL